MTGFFGKLFGAEKQIADGWTQPQREALIDLLIFAMYVDSHLSLAEEKVLVEQTKSLKWAGDRSVDAYVAAATSRIRELWGSEESRANLLEYIRERLGEFEDRERAFFVCESLLSADGRSEPELVFVDRCKAALKLYSALSLSGASAVRTGLRLCRPSRSALFRLAGSRGVGRAG